jgi:hypothetical protein
MAEKLPVTPFGGITRIRFKGSLITTFVDARLSAMRLPRSTLYILLYI